MASEKLWRAAAHNIVGWNKREIWSRDIHIIQMALPTVHENEIARQPDTICARYFGLNEGGVLAAPQDMCADLYFACQRPDKSNLGRL